MANNTSDDELRKLLKQFRLGGKPKSAWWTEYDEARLDETVLAFKQREEQVALEARIDELEHGDQSAGWLDDNAPRRTTIRQRLSELKRQLTTTHKGDK